MRDGEKKKKESIKTISSVQDMSLISLQPQTESSDDKLT